MFEEMHDPAEERLDVSGKGAGDEAHVAAALASFHDAHSITANKAM